MAALRRVDQVVPSLASRDAIGLHTLELRKLLREMGFESDIFYATCSIDMRREGRPLEQLGDTSSAGRALMYQLSIGSPAATAFVRRPEVKLVNYHNITPAELMWRWEPDIGEELYWGRRQLRDLAPVTAFAFAVSSFNRSELDEAGFPASAVAPLLVDLAETVVPDPAVAGRLARARQEGGSDLLFVGKVAPHKAQHDLIKALAVYRRLYDDRARLRVVGSAIAERYRQALVTFAEELDLSDGVDLVGSVTPEELVAYYRGCDVFVCLSDHEGFCAPIVEAMGHGLPVVAYGSTAVPETLGDAGVLLPTKEPTLVAAAVHRVLTDDGLRRRLAGAAAERVVEHSLDRARGRFRELLEKVLLEMAG